MQIVESRQTDPSRPGLWLDGSPQELANFTDSLIPMALGAAAANIIQPDELHNLAYAACRESALYSIPVSLKAPVVKMLDPDTLYSMLNARRLAVLKEGMANRVMSAAVRAEVATLKRVEYYSRSWHWVNSEGFVARPNSIDGGTLVITTFARGAGPWRELTEEELAHADKIAASHLAGKHAISFPDDPHRSAEFHYPESVWIAGIGAGNDFQPIAQI